MDIAPRDMPVDELRRAGYATIDWIGDYFEKLESLPVTPDSAPGELRRALPAEAPEEGEPMSELLADLDRYLLPSTVHWNHPSFFAYFNASSSGPGILAELISAAINSNSMIWQTGPAAHELEELTSGWLRRLLGLPDDFRGLFTDGGSASTFHALAAARQSVAGHDWRQLGVRSGPELRIYVGEHTHSSIHKAVLALGLGLSSIVEIPSDHEHRLRPEALEAAITEDLHHGRTPCAVVATLGTTSVTSLDPVAEIAHICRDHGIWLHVDAAHGGAIALLPEKRHLFDGWQQADSITINPHKWLMVPIDLSVLYTRRPDVLQDAFSLVPAYLRTATDLPATEPDSMGNLMDYGLSLGRRCRALKLWFVLRYFGRQGLIERLRGHLDSARWLAAQIDAHPWIERVAPVPLSTLCFRIADRREGADGEAFGIEEQSALGRRWLERVNATHELYISATELDGRYILRFVISGLRTERQHVEKAWKTLCNCLEMVLAESSPQYLGEPIGAVGVR